MKIAIILSGMPRNVENSYKWFKESVLDVLAANNINYDVFASTWANTLAKDESASSDGDKNNDDIVKLFKPVKFETEEWNDKIKDELRWPEFEKCQYEIIPRSSALGQWYKVFKCNELRKQHEQEFNIKYDVIIRCRTEVKYHSPIDIKELNVVNSCIAPTVFLRLGPNPQNLFWTKDTFAFGNRAGMEIYCNCHEGFVNVAQISKISTSELGLRNWLYFNNVKLEHTSLDYSLIRN